MGLIVLHHHGNLVLAPDLQVDDNVDAGGRADRLGEVARVDGQRHRILPHPVKDRGKSALGSQFSGDAFAGFVAKVGG